jgi:hypothetical protein
LLFQLLHLLHALLDYRFGQNACIGLGQVGH